MDSFAAYQRFTRSTAIYPGVDGYGDKAGTALRYLGLGLVGESGEVADKVKKIIRDGDSMVTEERRDALLAECGDVLWYAARVIDHCETTLGAVVGNPNLDSFGAFQGRVTDESRRVTHPQFNGTVTELNYLALLLCSQSGDAALRIAGEVVGGMPFTPEPLRAVLETLTRIIAFVGGNLGEVATANRDKLLSRQERGVLTGSGDVR